MVTSALKKIKHKTRIRTRYRDTKKKFKTVGYIYRTNGMSGLSAYLKEGVEKRVRKNTPIQETGDILFVSVDNSMLNHYRVDHMTETLESAGLSVGKVMYYDLTPEHVKRYNVFIFYRCPWIPQYSGIFKAIRKRNKVSIYAVDDLVIDRRYTDTLPVVQDMLVEDRKIYDDGVERHGKLMKHCDYAITTTKALANELKKYENLKEVYVDRNMRNDETIFHSDEAIKTVERDDTKVIIGYFSGTNTHNEDFQMVAPALTRIMDEYENVHIKLTGRVDAPEALKGYENRLIFTPLVDWRRLPFEMRECNITLSPLVDTLFNRAKSELKWADSSLVEVPVVASNMGASKEVITDQKTGVLVENTEEDWYQGLRLLVEDEALRSRIGKQAREYVVKNYSTSGKSAMKLCGFIAKVTPPVVAFAGVNISAISGGNMVVKKHMDLLQAAGTIVYGVESMNYHRSDRWEDMNRKDDKAHDYFRVNSNRPADKVKLAMHFDRYVATFWSSVKMVDSYPYMSKDSKKLYLVQNMEAGFYNGADKTRREVFATYNNHRIEPITISIWCRDWLKADFNRNANYAPNGIEIKNFPFKERNWSNRKIKVLVEGDSASEYKRVDESFKITNKLDRDRYEVAYMSYNAAPKDWYQTDRVYLQIPSDKVGEIYQEYDILVKSSVLESFSYPPLEIMATGGVPVLVKNDGNAEYIEDGVNALYYETGNVNDALAKIESLVNDTDKFKALAIKGYEKALTREWDKVSTSILQLYS
jgi:glycosyltransferase involved in cell wall biosynthesis